MKKNEVAKRFENDDDSNATYGYKLTKKFWNNAVQQNDLSLNEQNCVATEACSIAIHKQAECYFHVAKLDLATINLKLIGHQFAACYDPLVAPPDGPNSCHFELLPMNSSTQSLFALQTLLDSPFPPGRMPNSPTDRAIATIATNAYREVVEINRWVRDNDGELK